ncbi:MAG TPA: BPSS1780 family membrane protein [Fontimonas sp.]
MDQNDIRQVAVGRCSEWIGEGWTLFRQSPGTWIGLVVVWVLLLAVLGSVPLLGSLASNLLGPVFTAGVFLGCLRVERGEKLRIEDLFLAFKSDRLAPLIILGVLGIVVMVGVVLIALLFGFGSIATLAAGIDTEIEQMGAGVVIGGLVILLMLLPVAMALWFAAPLVMFARVDPVESLKLSFVACWRNMWSLSLWGLLALLIMIVAAIPVLLGWLIAGPVLMASYYWMYRDIFADAPLPATDVAPQIGMP